jgi:CheY-like chemotaxis protein
MPHAKTQRRQESPLFFESFASLAALREHFIGLTETSNDSHLNALFKEGTAEMADKKFLEGKRVLAVDDEQDVLDTLIDLLPMCEMVTASSFEKAKDLLESEKYDLVILDIMGVDGYGLLKMATRKNIPAVMLTAHAWSPDNLVRSIKEGAVSYLPKEELANITDYLNDVLTAKKEGRDPWASWHERLPASYFERRWGAAWKDTDRQFWETFKAGLKAKRSAAKKED